MEPAIDGMAKSAREDHEGQCVVRDGGSDEPRERSPKANHGKPKANSREQMA